MRGISFGVIWYSGFQHGVDDGEDFASDSHDGMHLLLACNGTSLQIVMVGWYGIDRHDS